MGAACAGHQWVPDAVTASLGWVLQRPLAAEHPGGILEACRPLAPGVADPPSLPSSTEAPPPPHLQV